MKFSHILAFLSLGRSGMAPYTMSIPVLAILITTESCSFLHLLWGALLGLAAHYYGFGLNDIIDYKIDKHAPVRQKSAPLVRGKLSFSAAWAFTLLQLPIALGIYYFCLNGGWIGLSILGASIFCSTIYNLWSKAGAVLNFIAELCLALSVGLLCFSVAFAFNTQPTISTYTFSIALAFILLSINSLSSGLKDLKTDPLGGGKSFVYSLGARVEGTDQLKLPKSLWFLYVFYQLIIASLLIYTAYLLQVKWYIYPITALLLFNSIYHAYRVLQQISFNLMRGYFTMLNGYFNYIALTVVVIHEIHWLWWFVVVNFLFIPIKTKYFAVPIVMPKKLKGAPVKKELNAT